jgi:hypothetical protein
VQYITQVATLYRAAGIVLLVIAAVWLAWIGFSGRGAAPLEEVPVYAGVRTPPNTLRGSAEVQ